MQYLFAALIGLFGGITSGMFGVGGGVVMVPAMVFLMAAPMRDNIKLAVGTSLLVIIPTAIMGTWRHAQAVPSNVDWRIGALLIPTAVAGSYIGQWFTTMISAGSLKRAFGGFLVLVGLRMLLMK